MTSQLYFYYSADDGQDIIKSLAAEDGIRLLSYEPLVSTDGGNITESARVELLGTGDAKRRTINDLNNIFERARNFTETQTGQIVYVMFDPGVATTLSATAKKSQLFDGRVILHDAVLGPWQYDGVMIITVEWTRQPFWEAYSSAQVAIPTVYNHDDSEHNNYIDVVAAACSSGDLPAAATLALWHTNAATKPMKQIFVFHNVYSYPSGNMVDVLEGEDATGATVTPTVEANCSAGSYALIEWTGTAETLIATWSIPKETSYLYAGGQFMALARFYGTFPYYNCFLRLVLTTSTDEVLWTGDLSLASTGEDHELIFLDTLRLPPFLYGKRGATVQDMKLKLYAKRNASTSSIKLDYLYLGAIHAGGSWLRLKSKNEGVPYGHMVVRNESTHQTYLYDLTTYALINNWEAQGELVIVPNTAQRFYILSEDEDGAASIAHTWQAILNYNPRWSTL